MFRKYICFIAISIITFKRIRIGLCDV